MSSASGALERSLLPGLLLFGCLVFSSLFSANARPIEVRGSDGSKNDSITSIRHRNEESHDQAMWTSSSEISASAENMLAWLPIGDHAEDSVPTAPRRLKRENHESPEVQFESTNYCVDDFLKTLSPPRTAGKCMIYGLSIYNCITRTIGPIQIYNATVHIEARFRESPYYATLKGLGHACERKFEAMLVGEARRELLEYAEGRLLLIQYNDIKTTPPCRKGYQFPCARNNTFYCGNPNITCASKLCDSFKNNAPCMDEEKVVHGQIVMRRRGDDAICHFKREILKSGEFHWTEIPCEECNSRVFTRCIRLINGEKYSSTGDLWSPTTQRYTEKV